MMRSRAKRAGGNIEPGLVVALPLEGSQDSIDLLIKNDSYHISPDGMSGLAKITSTSSP